MLKKLLIKIKNYYQLRIIQFKLKILKSLPMPTYKNGILDIPYIFSASNKLLSAKFSVNADTENIDFKTISFINAYSKLSIPSLKELTFRCNICGNYSTEFLHIITNREAPSCATCGSNLRFRSLISALTECFFKDKCSLSDIKVNPSITGLGLSDWKGYAKPLSQVFNYSNTFYHKNPTLDICNIPTSFYSKYDFIISSDVFEHIPLPLEVAFKNLFLLLKPGGYCIFSVPYKQAGATEEHFPLLFNYSFQDNDDGKRTMKNTTKDGQVEYFDNLVFHGGGGDTLEMRLFSKPDLINLFHTVGFDNIIFYEKDIEKYGIIWPGVKVAPIIVQRPL